jgi:hypothetical protein
MSSFEFSDTTSVMKYLFVAHSCAPQLESYLGAGGHRGGCSLKGRLNHAGWCTRSGTITGAGQGGSSPLYRSTSRM